MEGNQQKMRAALESAKRQLLDATESNEYGDDVLYLVGCMRTVAAACRAALSAPPRQCDVGTPGEQSERMEKAVCSKHRGCVRCPLRKAKYSDCTLVWAQTPYAEEGAGK